MKAAQISNPPVEGQTFLPSLTSSGAVEGNGWPAFSMLGPFGIFPGLVPFWPSHPLTVQNVEVQTIVTPAQYSGRRPQHQQLYTNPESAKPLAPNSSIPRQASQTLEQETIRDIPIAFYTR